MQMRSAPPSTDVHVIPAAHGARDPASPAVEGSQAAASFSSAAAQNATPALRRKQLCPDGHCGAHGSHACWQLPAPAVYAPVGSSTCSYGTHVRPATQSVCASHAPPSGTWPFSFGGETHAPGEIWLQS